MIIVVVCGMSDEKVYARLLPLVELEEIEKIFLVRRSPIHMPKVISLSLPAWTQRILVGAELYRFFALMWICLLRKPKVLYGIYFIPHGIYTAIAGWLFHIPVIQELIGTDRLKVMRSKLLFSILKSANRIGVRGQRSREQLINSGIPEDKLFTPISVNALDFNHFKPDDRPKIFDLIYCGRMDHNKQIDLLIQAVAELAKFHPGIRVLLLGDGPERENLKALTRSLDLQTAIKFAGNQPYEQIPNYLNQSRIFVMTSAFEGLPVAMIEALSCGLPVVVPHVGDIADLAQHGVNALLVEGATSEAYFKALDSLLTEGNLYSQLVEGALNARQHLIETYTLEKASAGFKQILLNITR